MTTGRPAPDASTEEGIAALVAAAEPGSPRRLGSLIDRLADLGPAGLRGARADGRAIGSAALSHLAVRGVAADSRRVRPGSLFVAIAGLHADGHDFVADAARAGAVAAVVERPVPEAPIPQLVVGRPSRALAAAAAWWYGDPSRRLAVVGVTGTDGKTTTSFLASAALEAAGLRTGLVGTVDTSIGGRREANEAHITTPEAPELQALLAAMVMSGDTAAVLETTSHALALDRVAEVAYDAAILTNLSHEHLELHGSFEAYRAAKLSLFERLAERTPAIRPRAGIVHRDDPAASLFEAVTREAGARLVTYGADPSAEVRATHVAEDEHGLRFAVATPRGEAEIRLRLGGRFNVHNALAVVALGEAWDLDAAAVRRGLEGLAGVPGRMERVDAGQPFGAIVDYAHSPASLAAVLDLLAPVAAARGGGLIAVFGSAGERDVAKRRIMGRIAGERCRIVVVTDEDPRGEDGDAILDEIARGAEEAGRHRGRDLLLIRDRAAAIAAAVERARPGDTVLFAGKGHERSIIGPDGPLPWDERVAVLAALAEAGFTAGPRSGG
ncbi:MAG: UDP-N-acetylmuramoyl-L-alanyl-D-glutamate--2,6-diaminopimelate ligase [Chloroflexi bacterium]|nr:UDP-N-acetylmuramoyl-L-alanyl-D-glutamate--2,6-diaminopimelate ligase [Chloroflexota bacterium]